MAYAVETKVSVNQTRGELEAMLKKAKAESIVHMDDAQQAVVIFRFEGRVIRFTVPIAKGSTIKQTDQLRRSRWRSLFLVIKAKLEAVDSKITTAEEEFLAHVMMPDGSSVADWTRPAIKIAFDKGIMPTSPLMIEGPKR